MVLPPRIFCTLRPRRELRGGGMSQGHAHKRLLAALEGFGISKEHGFLNHESTKSLDRHLQ